MYLETLLNDEKNYKKIVHISDIHIRLLKRHDEYQLVFDKFYKKLGEIKENYLIVITGDLFHTKLEFSPELIKFVSEFLNKLTEFSYVIIVAGNHDMNLLNKSRLDNISPIIDLLKNDKIFYLKKTGVYILNNIKFYNFSIFDKNNEYLKLKEYLKEDFDKNYYRVGIYHGTVENPYLSLDRQILHSNSLKLDIFDNLDIVLLGDIHLKQDLQKYAEN